MLVGVRSELGMCDLNLYPAGIATAVIVDVIIHMVCVLIEHASWDQDP